MIFVGDLEQKSNKDLLINIKKENYHHLGKAIGTCNYDNYNFSYYFSANAAKLLNTSINVVLPVPYLTTTTTIDEVKECLQLTLMLTDSGNII
jgi:hypothetical protein